MRRVGAVLEFFKVAGRRKGQREKQTATAGERGDRQRQTTNDTFSGLKDEETPSWQTCQHYNTSVEWYVHVGEVLHRQEHLCLNLWNLYPLQSPMANMIFHKCAILFVCVCVSV